jgi:predicted nuclease of predicted toxin-antitoxin system
MKLLLDENLPRKLKYRFNETFIVVTINEMKWNAKKNGELMQLLQDNGFQALITSDKNLQYQQNLDRYKIKVVVLDVKDNRYETVLPFVERIEKALLENPKNYLIKIE